MEHCKQCGAELNQAEIEKMKTGAKPYDFAYQPQDWGLEEDKIDWYCGDCARGNDSDVPEDWEVYYLG